MKTTILRNRHIKTAVIGFALLLIAAIIIIIATVRRSNNTVNTVTDAPEISDINSQSEAYEEHLTIDFAGVQVIVNENIQKNSITEDMFEADENGMLTYNKDAKYGIDVSAFQGEIDWDAVKESGIDFAVLRLGYRGMSEGVLYTDDCYFTNLEGAKAAGLDLGIYFFSQATTIDEAKAEAQYVLDVLNGEELEYPIFFDWEPGYDEADRTYPLFSSPVINDLAKAFCGVIENAGYKTGIYFNSYQGYLQYDLSLFDDVTLWLAEYDTKPEFYYAFDMWQYTCEGTVSGIETPVDVNIYFK